MDPPGEVPTESFGTQDHVPQMQDLLEGFFAEHLGQGSVLSDQALQSVKLLQMLSQFCTALI